LTGVRNCAGLSKGNKKTNRETPETSLGAQFYTSKPRIQNCAEHWLPFTPLWCPYVLLWRATAVRHALGPSAQRGRQEGNRPDRRGAWMSRPPPHGTAPTDRDALLLLLLSQVCVR
jgi:hypothetical protein